MTNIDYAAIAKEYGGSVLADDSDDFEKIAAEYGGYVEKLATPKRGFTDVIKDVGVTGIKAAVGLPQAMVGLADIPTGGHVGRALEGIGYRPNETQKTLESWYSPAQQEANRKVHEADGFTNTLQAAIQNPSVIATTVGESIPLMIGGAGVARGLIAAGKLAPWAAGAIGEGVMGAGSAAEGIRGQTSDGLLTAKQSLSAAASGIGTAAFGALGGKLANSKMGQKIGLADIDTMLAQGGANAVAAGQAKQGFIKSVLASGFSEGVLEELPQSIQEQMWQNYATDRPLTEGVGNAAALGLLAGGVMGGAGGGYNAMIGKVAQGQTPPDTADIPAGQILGTPDAGLAITGDALNDTLADTEVANYKQKAEAEAAQAKADLDAQKSPGSPLTNSAIEATKQQVDQAAVAAVSAGEVAIRTKQVTVWSDDKLGAFVAGAQINRNRTPSQELMLGLALEEVQRRQINNPLQNAPEIQEIVPTIAENTAVTQPTKEQANGTTTAPRASAMDSAGRVDGTGSASVDAGRPNEQRPDTGATVGGIGQGGTVLASADGSDAVAPAFTVTPSGGVRVTGFTKDQISAARDALKIKGAIIGTNGNAIFPKGTDVSALKRQLGVAETKPMPKAKKPQKASTDLLQRIKQLGGIDGTLALDITGEQRAPGGWKFAFKKGGTSLDDLATQLADDGFMIDIGDVDGGVQQLRDMIRAHIGGERNFKAQTQEAQDETASRSAYMDDLVRRAEAHGINWKNLTEQQLDDAVWMADDDVRMAAVAEQEAMSDEEISDAAEIVDMIDDGMDVPFGDEVKTNTSSLQAWLGEDDYGQESSPNPVEASRRQAQENPERGARTGDAAQGGEGFALESHTNAEVLAREAAAKKSEEEANKEPPAKNVTADQADMFANQGALFNSNREQPANQTSFVKSPDGSIDFGEITADMAQSMRRQSGKIRLERGNADFGLEHIESRHGKQIRSLGFTSIKEFVSEAVKNVESIWSANKTSQMVMIQSHERGKAVFIQLKPAEGGDYYTVNTAFPVSDSYAEKKNWEKLWGRESVPAGASGASSFATPDLKAGNQGAMTSSQSKDNITQPAAESKPADEATRAKEAMDAAGVTGTDRLQTLDDVSITAKYSRATSGKTGLPVSTVESIAKPIAEKLKNVRTVKVVQRQNEIPGIKEAIDVAFSRFRTAKTLAEKRPTQKNQERRDKLLEKYMSVANNNIEGAYVNGELYLVASNLPSAERVQEVLRHEVAHLSVEQMLGQVDPSLYPKLINQVKTLDTVGNKYIRELAKAVDKSQPGLDKNTRAAEIIAQIAERGDHDTDMPNAVRSLWQRISDGIKAFYKLVFGDNLTDQDVRDIVAQSFRWARGEGDAVRVVGGVRQGALASKSGEKDLDFTGPKAYGENVNEGDNHGRERAQYGYSNESSRAGKDAELGATVSGAQGERILVHRAEGRSLRASDFEREALGFASGSAPSGRGVHFYEDKSQADSHAEKNGLNVNSYVVRTRKPYKLTIDDLEAFANRDWSVDEYYDWREGLRKDGHDAITIDQSQAGGKRIVIAFDPNQVTTATEGVKLSRAPAQSSISGIQQPPAQPPRQNSIPLQSGQSGNNASWDAPEPSKLDNFIYTVQNKHVDMKRAIEAIKATGKQLADQWNTYLQEELFHGRAAKRTQDFVNTELKPLLVEMQMRGQTVEELDEYLHARHAKEANALIADRDPNMQDGGSGMTNQEADDYFSGLPADKQKRLEATAKRVDAIIAKTRELYVSYGLVSKNQADEWAAMFKHYVPLMREDHDGGMGVGQGFSIKGKEVKHRTGSTAAVVDIFANIALQREKAITRGEKNRVAVSLAGLAKLNPNPDFWTFGKAPTERVLNEATGLIEERADPMFKSRPNVVVAKIKDGNGQIHERAVIFNEHDERAMRMAEAIKNLDATHLGMLLGTSAKITRYFSSINTQYNPVFGVTNLVRDTGGMALNLSSTPIAGHRLEVLKNIPSALAGIFRDARSERKGHAASSQWAQLWEELQDTGGMTGYRDLYRTSEDRANAIKRELDPYAWHNNMLGKIFTAGGALKVPMEVAQKKAGWLFDMLSDYNLAMEGATRLSAYKVAIENGMSKQQAASLAKNITVNFNRKGQMGQQAGALYAFFNASMQGTARIGETMFKMEGGDIKTLRLNQAGKAIVYGGITLGAMQALALAFMGFGDDEPPEFVRERSLIIPIGGKRYITIPMPLGFHAIPNIGRITTEWAMSGFKKPGDRAMRLIGVFADAFNPIGSSGVSMQTIAPTALDPFAALAENKDWTGKPIYKPDFNSLNPTPGFTRNKDTATYPSKMIAEGLNYISGGDKYKQGLFSPTADQIDYLFGQVTGGVGRELSKVEQTGVAAYSGEDLPTHKIPLVGRFYGNSEDQSIQSSRFYDNLKTINEIENGLKGRMKDHQPTKEFREENPEYRLIMLANHSEKEVSKLHGKKRELIEKDAPKEQIKAIDDRINAAMSRLNEAVRKLRERKAA